MARIAICANTTWNISHFRMPIVEGLRARGHDIIIVAKSDGSEAKLRAMGCEVIGLAVDAKGINPLKDLTLMLRLLQLYARKKPAVILNFTIKAVIYGSFSARSLGIPVINTITGLGTAFIEQTWLTSVVHKLYRLALPGSQPVVFQNEEDLALFRQRGFITSNPVTVVPGSGVDLLRFRWTPMPREGPITFLFIGRLLRDKGIGEFAEAARRIKSTYTNVHFQVLGPLAVANRTAIAEESISQWVEEGTIEYLGPTDDVRRRIKEAHCVVLPSYREGMPRALLEGAAMGRPLIATAVAGCHDVVRHGVNGYLCAPSDGSDLASKMRSFIELSDSKRTEMGQASRILAEECFDVKKVVEAYLGLTRTGDCCLNEKNASQRKPRRRHPGRGLPKRSSIVLTGYLIGMSQGQFNCTVAHVGEAAAF
jgi:glycosyltransferase involved in cell wall biosynthesis